MIIAVFVFSNKLDKAQFFEVILLVTVTSIDMVLRILLLSFNNVNAHFDAIEFT